MSSTKSLVEGFLNGEGRTNTGTDSESASTTQSEIEDTVKSAVSEALEEHEQEYHSGHDESESADEQSSGGRSKLKAVFVLGVLVGAGLFARRKMSGSSDGSSV